MASRTDKHGPRRLLEWCARRLGMRNCGNKEGPPGIVTDSTARGTNIYLTSLMAVDSQP